MGGKDAIVVADDADLDSAAAGAVQAAFGYQGQKCSACSRLIVDEKVHDALVEKVVALTKALKVGSPTEGDTNMAAVINKRSFDKTLDYIKKGESEGGTIVAGGSGVGCGRILYRTDGHRQRRAGRHDSSRRRSLLRCSR
jgi:1-pyrroline-5-carboxylate dehydrogenase